ERTPDMRYGLRLTLLGLTTLGMLAVTQPSAKAAPPTVANPICPTEVVFYSPGNGQDIVVPPGYVVSAFATGLNMPTGIAFKGKAKKFEVYVLESGHGLPSICNEQASFGTGTLDPTNPFTPDILVFDQDGNKIAGPLGKPTALGPTNTGFQAAGP